MTMASTALKDFIGNWQLFLVGLLLSVSPVLGAVNNSSSDNSTTSSVTTSGVGNTMSNLPPTVATTTAQAIANTSQTQSNTQGPTPAPVSLTDTTPTAAAMTSMGLNTTAATSASQSTAATSASQPSAATSATQPTASTSATQPTAATSATQSSAATSATQPMPTATGVSSSVTSSSWMNPSMTTSMGNTTGGLSNGTTAWSNSSMSTISCRSFMCNYSDCYSMYTSQNASMCPYGYNYCELTKETDIWYTVNCSASCSMSCGNTSQSNCSVNCCNSTNCLNDTFASMMMTTSTMMTTGSATTTTASPTTTTMAPTTQAGKKCHTGQCKGATCYTNFKTHEVCSSSELHCQLKKETVGSDTQWTAGCTTNCSEETTCKTDSTPPPCHLECCNATLTSSCLMLNGTLNVPSFATRGPQRHSELVTSILVVFVISLML